MYNSTAEEVAQYYGIDSHLVVEWARKGYPVRQQGQVKRVKLVGAQQVGVKLWRFNLKAIINFIENIGDEKWASLNESIKQRTVKLPKARIGVVNSISTPSDTAKQCLALALSQRRAQKNYVTS